MRANMSDFVDIHALNVVHFTHGATDPLRGLRAHGVRVVMLADGAIYLQAALLSLAVGR